MTSTYVVVDLGYGDSGKGTIVDAIARRCPTPPLVVRHNGGAQAGHNVHTSDGRHHTFSQFGAGTFVPGSRTLLSKHFILHPAGLLSELQHLREIGIEDADKRLLVDGRALVVTPFQQALNQLRELSRMRRHGTCGLGIGETVSDSLTSVAVRVRDLRDREYLREKLAWIQASKREEALSLGTLGLKKARAIRDMLDLNLDELTDSLLQIGSDLRILKPEEAEFQIRESEHVVFEGAQGVLLDEWHGFHPHTTWSTTTTKNANNLIAESGRVGPVRRIGVVRAYATRHGEGPFPTRDPGLQEELRDSHNVDTGWQGEFRVGWFDAPLTRYALEACGDVGELAVTCLDRMEGRERPLARIGTEYQVAWGGGEYPLRPQFQTGEAQLSRQRILGETLANGDFRPKFAEVPNSHLSDEIQNRLQLPVTIRSYGRTAEDKQWVEE